jgi:hypothetical protein
VFFVLIVAVMSVIIISRSIINAWRLWLWLRRGQWLGSSLGSAVNDLIELTSVQPYAPALWTVVNFNSASFGNEEGGVIVWTFHGIYYTAYGNAMIKL